MKNPLVSVIIPTHNRAYTLRRALDSVKMQVYRPMEVIIVDDNSDDDTQLFLEKYDFGDIVAKNFKSLKKLGPGKARNMAMQSCTGDYFVYLDSDDEWLIDKKISMQVEFLNDHPDYGFVSTYCKVMDEGIVSSGFSFADDGEFRKFALNRCLAHTSTWMLRASIYSKIGGFWSLRCEDYEYLLRIGTVTKCHCIPVITEKYFNDSKGDYQKNIVLSFFVGLLVCIIYSISYPNFKVAFVNRLSRGYRKFITFKIKS